MAAAPPKAPDLSKSARLPKDLLRSTMFLVKRLGDLVKERVTTTFTAAGCNPYHQAVLALLDEGDRETQASIADALGFDRSHLVGMLDELEADRLIERRRDTQDRRRHMVSMTQEGKRALAKRRAMQQRIEDDFLEPLTDRERAQLHALLLRLASHHDSRYAVDERSTEE